MEKIQNQRLKHLQFYIQNSINNIQYDPIIQQMGKHQISSNFVTERITEYLSKIISMEQEEYIQQISDEIITANKSKKDAWRILKNEMNTNEENILIHSKRNVQLQRQMCTLKNLIDKSDWNMSCEEQIRLQKIQEAQKQFNNSKQSLNKIHKSAGEIKTILAMIKNDFLAMNQCFQSEFKQMNPILKEKINAYQQFAMNQLIKQKIHKEKTLQNLNEQMVCSMNAIMNHINECYQFKSSKLTLENIDFELDHILEYLSTYNRSEIIDARNVKMKMEKIEREYQYKMNKTLHAQQIKLGILRSNLHDLELLLEQSVDDGMSSNLLKDLENQHISYTLTTKNKTDELIQKAISQSGMMINSTMNGISSFSGFNTNCE